MQRGDISVIIPTFNRADFIGETIESVLGQTRQPREIIVVDDGSTDNTEAVLSSYHGRLRAIRQPNSGVAAARNTGLEHASGAYVAFVDSDDLYLPDMLEVLAAHLDAHPEVGLVYGRPYIIRDRDTTTRYQPEAIGLGVGRYFNEQDRLAASIMRGNLMWVPTVLVRRTALDALPHPGFDEDLSPYADWDMWLRLVLHHTRVARIPHFVALYREHGHNMRLTRFAEFERDHNRIVAKIVRHNLDGWLPLRVRQDYRVRNLKATIASRSLPLVLTSLSTIVLPCGRPSPYGLLLLMALTTRFLRRMVRQGWRSWRAFGRRHHDAG